MTRQEKEKNFYGIDLATISGQDVLDARKFGNPNFNKFIRVQDFKFSGNLASIAKFGDKIILEDEKVVFAGWDEQKKVIPPGVYMCVGEGSAHHAQMWVNLEKLNKN